MKTLFSVLITLLFLSCLGKKTGTYKEGPICVKREIMVPEFQTIIDTSAVEGAILIYDFDQDSYYSNDFTWAKNGKLPASTFKITNSIIALETGVVENDSTVFKWNGEERSMKLWQQDLVLRDAFHFSCVPCYQELARKIGVHKMTEYLEKLEYGHMKVDSSNIDRFWLEGASRIDQMQQIHFLKKFYQAQLPISERTKEIMKRLMLIEENDTYKIYGKTGWSVSEGHDNGWFVGYIETQKKVYFFAKAFAE